MRRARDLACWIAGLIWALVAGTADVRAQVRDRITPSITIRPEVPQPSSSAAGEALQLEVFVNDRPLNIVSAFTLIAGGRMASTFSEPDEIGLRVPAALQAQPAIPLAELSGVSYRYDEGRQAILIRASATALKPRLLDAQVLDPAPAPTPPPFGAILNYAAYASASRAGSGVGFDGLSTELQGRVFGRFGLIESSGLLRLGGGVDDFTRLNTRYVREDATGLRSLQVGDFISGGFAWTRSIRMAGLQLRRNFALRPDLITAPLPVLTGSAAAPSTVDLFVNNVRAFSASVPEGPFQLTHPPLISGAGVASLVLHDALGREVVSRTRFYASPQLLAPGLSDFSLELGFPRRNFGTRSADYSGEVSASASWRKGLSQAVTLELHGEATREIALLGSGVTFTVGHIGAMSVAASASRSPIGTGAMVNASFESRVGGVSLLARAQRVFGRFEDLASWTEVLPPHLNRESYLLGRPRELDQVTLSLRTPWRGGGLGASYIRAGGAGVERSRVVTLSLNQELGPFSLYASAFADLDRSDTRGAFLGLSLPLGHGISATGGLTRRGGAISGFAEVSRHDNHEPGVLGWTLRAAGGERQEGEAIIRYGTWFAHGEAGLRHSGGEVSAHGMVEGAFALVGGGLHASQRIEDSFAVIEVGAPDVAVFHENRLAGRTDARGQAIVPHLRAYVGNRIAVDPENLPLDAEVLAEVNVAPYARVPVRVDMRVDKPGGAALVGFVDEAGKPLPLGAEARLAGGEEAFVIGYDGVTYLRGLSTENAVEIVTPEGATCRAHFAFAPVAGQQVQIGGVPCRSAR